jgi:hypothetical protein
VVVFLGSDVVLTSLRTKRISSFRKFRLLPTKDFFDSIDLSVAKYKSGGDRSLKQTAAAAMWPPRVVVKRGRNC